MPPKTQIPKEKILRTGLDLVIREGYEVINIKRLAQEIGCSTQPISWSFGNILSHCITLSSSSGSAGSTQDHNMSQQPPDH